MKVSVELDELRNRVLRLLGESATRRNQITQADSYLAGIEREMARLKRETQRGHAGPIIGLEEAILGCEEVKTRKDRAANVIRAEECDRERADLEEKLNAENR